jgi:hypothetical protein
MYSLQVILSYAVLTLKVRSIPTLILIEPKTGKLACIIYSKSLHDAVVDIVNRIHICIVCVINYACCGSLTKSLGKFTIRGVEIVKAGAPAFPWTF